MTQAYPLSWPIGKPRTPDKSKQADRFKSADKAIKIDAAFERLQDQVDRLGGADAVLSSNLELTMSGRPRMDRAAPWDSGVCLYFRLKGQPYAMACDTFRSVQQNIAAIAQHIEATRRIEAYGVATAAEVLANFMALPPPASHWARLGVPVGASKQEVETAFKALALQHHPDKPGGSQATMAELTEARNAAIKEIDNG